MEKKRFSYSTKAVLLITLLLLALNIIMGMIFAMQSRNAMRQIINEKMMGVAKTAGAMLNGDELADIKDSDIGSKRHNEILSKLKIFSDNFEFEYIYVVRPEDDGKFIFIADPDEEDPAEYGEPIVDSPALRAAGNGKAAVDRVSIGDEWGKFYTAYCPVMTADGEIGGIVGVDFDAEWYENQLTKNSAYIIFSSAFSLVIGGSMMMLVTMKLKQKLDRINEETESISADVTTLLDEINSESGYSPAVKEPEITNGKSEAESGIERLSSEVKVIKEDLRKYIDFVHVKAYTDGMTGVGNKTAYLELVRTINDELADGEINFSIAVFDVDGLKLVNDEFGHETGDDLINGTAACIKNVFGAENVYRIGGDEFIAVLRDYSSEDMERAFAKLDEEIKRINADYKAGKKVMIAFSRGYATFDSGLDKAFKNVFRRADKKLYEDKNEHHKSRDSK